MLQLKKFHARVTMPSHGKRVIFFCLLDALIIGVSLLLSFLFYFDLNKNINYYDVVREVIAYFLVIKIAALFAFRTYNMSWRYAGINDLLNIVFALVLAELFLLVLSLPNGFLPTLAITSMPKRIFIEDGIVSVILISGVRISKRIYLESIMKHAFAVKGKRCIVLGAGNTGDMIIRDMARIGYREFFPVCLLDDDAGKLGTSIHGIKVRGGLDDLHHWIAKERPEALVVAIPALNHKKLKEVYDIAHREKVQKIKIVPRIYSFDTPDLRLKALEDISIEDLIGRQTVEIEYGVVSDFIRGKTVLVTGAGGSIGSELVLQVCAFKPAGIILLDVDDTELHTMMLKIRNRFPRMMEVASFIIGDVRDEQRIREVFSAFKPHIVFHAAALKHVPMMEYNPKEAVKVNIFGTYTVAKTAMQYGVEKFIMISTDKAVRPTSIMGATKRVAEFVCQAFNGANNVVESSSHRVIESGIGQSSDPSVTQGTRCKVQGDTTSGLEPLTFNLEPNTPHPTPHILSSVSSNLEPLAFNLEPLTFNLEPPSPGRTRFVSVRFGNVLGSRGSVIPLFLEQLKNGGPLTVTHKDMVRYFMTIPEAVSLILQASTMGEGGEVFVLDMGEPIKIVELARELISIQGLKPYVDVDIEFTGTRPGEKIFEEILTAEEGTVASRHQKVFVAKNEMKYSLPQIDTMLQEFTSVMNTLPMNDTEGVRDLLKKYVRHYEAQ